MKLDTAFPPPPQHRQPPLPCSDITPARQRALDRLSDFATTAEGLIGTLNIEHPESSIEYPATARGFVLFALRASPFASEVAGLLSRSKLTITENDEVDAPHVMIVDVRRHWGVISPLRGDVVIFGDGHAAIVTQPLCMGCQHFEAVSLTTDALPASDAPQIARLTHWLSTVRWIVRLVDEGEDDPQIAQMGQISKGAQEPDPASGIQDQASSNEPPAKRKRKITGI